MEYHLDYGLQLVTDPEYKSLYEWAIKETGVRRAVDRDLIPWPWTLQFTATSCGLFNSIEIERPFSWNDSAGQPSIRASETIRILLRPGIYEDGDWDDAVSYSMFGTNRRLDDIFLNVTALADPSAQEHCRAWGGVSYTAEVDFRNRTEPDTLWFYLQVQPSKFSSFAQMIRDRAVDKIHFSVGSVDGFYSGWSPGISTSSIKVLTAGDVQTIQGPPDMNADAIPRLGLVGDARLIFRRDISFLNGPPPLPRR